MLRLLGLDDTYVHDGRVLIEELEAWAVPQSLRSHRETLRRLGEVYKQLNAPFGSFGMDALTASTNAIKSGSTTGDKTYTKIEGRLDSLTNQRDAVASQIKSLLDAASFDGRSVNERQARKLIEQAGKIIERAHELAKLNH
jgi:hypothetical protein